MGSYAELQADASSSPPARDCEIVCQLGSARWAVSEHNMRRAQHAVPAAEPAPGTFGALATRSTVALPEAAGSRASARVQVPAAVDVQGLADLSMLAPTAAPAAKGGSGRPGGHAGNSLSGQGPD